MHRSAPVVVLTLVSLVAFPGPAAAGVLQQHPVFDAGQLVYDDELEFNDGFTVTERTVGGETELVYERTTGAQPLRSLRQGCVAESDDLVRCRALGDITRLRFDLIAGDDIADASGVRSFSVRAATGSGDAVLTGGALGDVLISNEGNDSLTGGPGDDRLEAGGSSSRADSDTLDGGPGRDTLIAGGDADVIAARDGERDAVDCGPSNDDFVAADDVDDVRNCEIIDLPPRGGSAPEPPSSPAAFPTPATPPAATPAAGPPAVQSARRARSAITIRCLRRGLVRVTARKTPGFDPVKLVTAGGRAVRRAALRTDVRVSGRKKIRATATGRDGRRLKVTKLVRRC